MATISYVLQDLGSYPYKTFRCTLDGQTYEMTWKWNERCQFWTVAIGFVGEDPLIKYKVTSYSDPMNAYGYIANLPDGKLLCFSAVQPDNRVAQDSIGEDNIHQFVFIQ